MFSCEMFINAMDNAEIRLSPEWERLKCDSHALQYIPGFLEYLRRIHRFLDKDSEDYIGTPTIGQIAYMPPPNITNGGLSRDWALIRLDQSKFPDPIMNKVLVDRQSLATVSLTQMDLRNDFVILREPKSREFAHGPSQSFRVAKYGARTRLRFGLTSEIKAVLKTTLGRMTGTTWKWIVVGSEDERPFTMGGDSGSCVFDMQGRAVGLVTQGSVKVETDGEVHPISLEWSRKYFPDRYRVTDIAMVTPIQLVFDDIQEVTGCRPEVV
jgi:hypothetical protein